mgnify:CR=1 FL=1
MQAMAQFVDDDIGILRVVDAALAGLSRRDQRFVELYFAEARSPESIADEMGVSVATVYSKKAKIKMRLAAVADSA